MTTIALRKNGSRLLLFAVAAMSFACAKTRAAAGSVQQLSGSDWRLTELNGRPAVPSDTTRRPWIKFEADAGRVSGSAGCNRMSGSFRLDGASIDFGAMVSTKMACADPALNQQEQDLFIALENADRYEVSGHTLVLRKGDTALARFTH